MPLSKLAIAAGAVGVTGVIVLRKPKRRRRHRVSMDAFVLPRNYPDAPTTSGGTPPPAVWPWQTREYTYSGKFMSIDADTPIDDLPIPNVPALPGPIAATYTAIASHLGETLKNLISSLSGMHSTAKTPGRWMVVATRPGSQALVDAVVQWGRIVNGKRKHPCAEMRFAGERASTGPLPLVDEANLPGPGDPKSVHPDPEEIVAYCRGDEPSFVSKWIVPPGPTRPQIELASEGGTLALLLWLPSRGDKWWYDVAFRWKKTG